MFGLTKFAVACFWVMVLTLASSAAQPEARTPSMSISAMSIDAREYAARLHGYIQVSVTDYENSSAGYDDPLASCHPTAANQPAGTIWFRFSVPAGSLSFSTSGSAIVSTDPNGAHLVAIYRESGSTLAEAGCTTGTVSAAATLTGMHLSAGEYYVVVGVPNGETISSGSLLLTMDYTPDTVLSNDDFANAKRLKFPANPAIVSLENATYEPDEPVSSCATSQRPSNSIWYTFKLDHTSAIEATVLFAQATNTGIATTKDIVITLFEATPTGLTEIKCSTGTANPRADGLLKPGTYYIRLEIDQMGGFGQSGIVQMSLSASVGIGSPYFTNPDTMTADMTGWTVTNSSSEDTLECSGGGCMFIMHSSGAAEATMLKTTASLTNVKLKKNDRIGLAILYGAETAPNAKALMIITFTDGRPPLRFGGTLDQTGMPVIFNASVFMTGGKVSSIKVKIKNKDQTAGSKLYIGAVIPTVLRMGEIHQRGTLPVPPPAQ